MKSILSIVCKFVLSNLLCLGIYLCVMLFIVIFFYSSIETLPGQSIISMFIYAFISFGFSFPFYFIYFLQNNEFKMHFIKHTSKDKWNMKQEVKRHFYEFGKQELLVMLFFYIILAFIPSYWLGRSGVGFAFSSVWFFYRLIPIQPLAVLIWVLYVGLAYVICLMFAYKKWDKERLYSEG